MATGTSLDISPPDSWEQWETIVADLARRELADPLAVKHGRQGQEDYGVDVYARPGDDAEYVGLQCKRTESLSEGDIESEIEDAREFEPPLDEYVIVWTGERDTEKQERARMLGEEEGFSVRLWPWEEVRERLAHHPDLLETHFREERDLYSELRNGGFVRLSESHFDDQDDQDLEDAWSAGLRPVDVREGYAIDRWRDVSGEDENEPTWVSMTGELLRRLEDENVMVRGRPGSGKSAICLFVANQWYEQGKGAVFYRPSGTPRQFRADGTLKRAIETAEGHVLVVVEDAVREETKEIHDVIHDLASDDSVSFLLDGRYWEDQKFDVGAADTTRGRQMSYHDHVSHVDLGRMNVAEVGQMVALYEAETGEEVDVEIDHLMQRLDRPGWVGDMLHVTYHLLSGEGVSGLEADVAAKFDALNDPEDKEMARSELQHHDESLLIRSGLLLNLLNLAGIPLHRVFVDALPEAMDEDYRQDDLDSLVDDALRGWLVFGGKDDEVLMGRHELWSFHFLRYAVHGHEDEEDEEDADDEGPVRRRTLRRWITDSVNAVVAVLDDPDRRSRFMDDVGATDESEESEETTPEEVASSVLWNIFGIGSDWPTLAPLFRQDGEDDDYAIRDADVCPDWMVAETLARRGDVLRKNNDLEGQEREEEITRTFEQAIETLGEAETKREKRAKTRVLDSYATFYEATGKYEEAIDRLERCLELHEEIENQAGKATTLNNLGVVHEARGEWDRAEEYYEDGLAINHEVGNRAGEATTCNNLGEVHRAHGEWATAEKYYEDSLAIQRQIGDRAGEAATRNNLGHVYYDQGEWDEAEEHFEASLAIMREIGDRAGEARGLGNLGKVFEAQEELDAAVENHRKALAIQREIDDRQAEAVSLINLGCAFSKKGDHETAYEHLNDGVEMLFDIDAVRYGLTAFSHLVNVCKALGKPAEAVEHCERALETIENADLPGLDDDERRFREDHAKLSSDDAEQNVLDLYTFALQRVRSDEPIRATELFDAVWSRQDDVDEDADVYPLVLAGGVSLVGHLQMFPEVADDYSENDVDSILQEIEPDRDRLPLPAKAVFEHLHEGETETTPESLHQLAQWSAPNDGGQGADEPPIGALNAKVFAFLLTNLQADD